MRLAYEHGVLEPLARATFKVLPARYLQERGKAADDEGFARRPFGTGPFRYEGRELEGGREVAVFRANPFYGQRPGRFGLPTIREIRFLVPTASTLPADVAAGQLHFYPDAPPDVAARLRAEPALKDVMRVATAKVNRRVHILAVNHRQTPLQNDKLRQGLSAAIDRDVVLKEQFRGSDLKAHVALTGPFPRTCWATPPAARDTPLFKPGAGGLIAEGLAGRPGVKLRLLYCDTDPKNGPVCQLLKTQIERAAAGADGKPVVLIEVMGMPSEAYRNKLYLEHDFDLALTTFDYRDDLYTLGGLLDPDAADRDGRNFLGYLAAGTNPAEADRRLKRVVEEIRQYRDFTKQVKEKTWDLHGLCNQRVPFIPLWQLDRYTAVHRDLEIFLDNPDAPAPAERLDPAIMFTGVEMWRLR